MNTATNPARSSLRSAPIDQTRRFLTRRTRRAALLANHDVLTDRLVGIRTPRPLAYAVNLPRWW